MKILFYLILPILFISSCGNKISITLDKEITQANTRLLKENKLLHTELKNKAIQEPEQYNVIVESLYSYDSIQNTSFRNKKELFQNLNSIKRIFNNSSFFKESINKSLTNINYAYLSNFKEEIITHELFKLRNTLLLMLTNGSTCGGTLNTIKAEVKDNSILFFNNGNDSINFNKNIKNINIYTSTGTLIKLKKTINQNTYWKIVTEPSNSKEIHIRAKVNSTYKFPELNKTLHYD